MATKVPLNFMWADESVLQEDIQQGISEDMVKWANVFYDQIDTKFELDVNPLYPLTKSRAAKYVLAKSSGVTADLRPRENVLPADMKELKRLTKQIEDTAKRHRDLNERVLQAAKRLGANAKSMSAASRVLANATDPQEIADASAEITRLDQEINTINATLDNATKSRDAAWAVLTRLEDARHALSAKMDEKIEVASGDRMFRIQMALRYVLEGIGSRSRINIVFCKAKTEFGDYRVNGETRDALKERMEVVPGQFLLWPYQYIVIDLTPRHRSTLAHEVVHLWGHLHPDARVLFSMKKVSPLINFSFPSIEEKPGGYFDGAETDIMNSTRHDPEAKGTTMSERDQTMLKQYFENLVR